MKHLKVFALLALALLAFSCKKVVPPFLTLKSSEAESVLTEGDVVNIKFSTNTAWTAQVSESWVTLSPTSGEGVEEGTDFTVKASVLKNDATDSRSATVTIDGGSGLVRTVTITQGQMDALNVKTADFEVEAEGGTVEVPVSANIDYSVEIPKAVDWITVVSTKAMADSKITLAVAPSYDEEVRSATVTVTGAGLSSPVKISQKAFVPVYDMTLPDGVGMFSGFGDGDPLVLEADCTSFTIPVNTNMEQHCYFAPWDSSVGAAVETNDVGWIKFEYDNEKIVFTLEPNDTYLPREEYFYSGCFVGDIDFGAYGSCILIRQKGQVPTAGANLLWTEQLSEIGVPSAYNRLAYKTLNGDALLLSDGEKIHAIDPATGAYWKAITPSVTPTSIASDDAGNVIIAPDYEFHPGTSYDIYWTADINAEPQVLIHHDADFDGTIGSFRVRGDLGQRAVVTGFVSGNRYWAGWEIDNYKISMDNYYAQDTGGQARGPIAVDADAWNPESGAVMSLGPRLNEGIVYRAYDTNWCLHYLKDAYTPNWLTPYDWKVISDAGAGAGNENQNNMDIIDYNGRRIIAYTQGAWFAWGGNSDVYILDVTDPEATQVLAIFDGSQLSQPEAVNADAPYADVLLHNEEGLGLVLYVVNSSYQSLSKLLIVF